jgi:hypothetical protein
MACRLFESGIAALGLRFRLSHQPAGSIVAPEDHSHVTRSSVPERARGLLRPFALQRRWKRGLRGSRAGVLTAHTNPSGLPKGG